jgi:hypothetical protein
MADDTLVIGSVFDPAGLERGLNQAQASLDRFAKTAAQSASFKSIGRDVDLATADFKSGKIALDDYTSALNHAKSEFLALREQGIEPSRARLLQIDTALGRSTGRAGELGTGIARLRSGMAQLAVTSLGASNALGQVAQGALFLGGGGSGAIIKIALAIATVGFASKKLGEEQAEATQKAQALLDKLKEQAAAGTPLLQATKDLNDLLAAQDRILASIAKRKALFGELPTGFVLPNVLGLGAIQQILGFGNLADKLGLKALQDGIRLAREELEKFRIEAGQKLVRDLSIQVATFGMSAEAAQRFALAMDGSLDPAIRKSANSLLHQLERLREHEEAIEAAAKADKDAADAAKELAQFWERLSQTELGMRRETFKAMDDFWKEFVKDMKETDDLWADFRRNTNQAIESLDTFEEIHADFLNKTRDAFLEIADASTGLAQTATSIGLIGEEAGRAITDVINLADALNKVALARKLGEATTGSIIGAIGAGLGLLGGLLGGGRPSETDRLLEENNQRLRELRDSLDRSLGTEGLASEATKLAAIQELPLFRGKGGVSPFIDPRALERALNQAGLTVEDWAHRIESLTGIDVLNEKGLVVAAALEQAREAIDLMAEAARKAAVAEEARLKAEEAAGRVRRLREAPRLVEEELLRQEEFIRQQRDAQRRQADLESRLLGEPQDIAAQFQRELDLLKTIVPGLGEAFEGIDLGDPLALREKLLELFKLADMGEIRPEIRDEFFEFLGLGADLLDSFNESVEDATKTLSNIPHGINLAALEFRAQAAGGGPSVQRMPGDARTSVTHTGDIYITVETQPGQNATEIARAVHHEFERRQMSRTGNPDYLP